MKPLIDELYELSFGKKVLDWSTNKKMRGALTGARRFILDEAMSSFLADLAYAVCQRGSDKITLNSMNHMRRLARLPHDVTWIEFDVPHFDKRETELSGERLNFTPPDDERHLREGWLLNGFTQADQEYRIAAFRLIEKKGEKTVLTLPLAINWATHDGRITFYTPGEAAAGFLAVDAFMGASGLDAHMQQIRVSSHELIDWPEEWKQASSLTLKMVGPAVGWATGIMRRVWPLLATINDIPTFIAPARLAKGFRAKAQYHRFLEHKVISLHVPQREEQRRKLARHIVATAKRRAHMVRGHWRKDIHHSGERIWVREHQRGDASLGFVTHDYQVLH